MLNELLACPSCGRVFENDESLKSGDECPSDDCPSNEVTYLTNACGEDTGYGTLELSEADCAKVAFEQGPGCVLPYIVEIEGVKYVLGNLEVAFKDEFWGDNGDRFDDETSVRAYCKAVCNDIRPRLSNGMRLLPIDEGDPGRLIVRVAIPLDGLASSEETAKEMRRVFGKFVDLDDVATAQNAWSEKNSGCKPPSSGGQWQLGEA